MASSKRTEPSTAIKRVPGIDANRLAQIAAEDTSLSGMDQYRIIPRFKVIQSMTAQQLKDQFGEGSVIIRPGDAPVWKKDQGLFLFVPHLFYVEYSKFSDRKDKESPVVVDRSFNDKSEIARRANNPELRWELYPDQEGKKEKDQLKFRYVVHFRFPGEIYGDHPLAGTPVVMSFEKGEFGQGKRFISGIKMRLQEVSVANPSGDGVITKNMPVPLWAQVWGFTASLRSPDNGNKWFGLDYHIPEQTTIEEHQIDEFRAKHLALKAAHEASLIRVDGEEQDEADPAEVDASDPNAKF